MSSEVRHPTRKELGDVLRAEQNGTDLEAEEARITVYAMRKDGSHYKIGHVNVSPSMSSDDINEGIDLVKFGPRPRS